MEAETIGRDTLGYVISFCIGDCADHNEKVLCTRSA